MTIRVSIVENCRRSGEISNYYRDRPYRVCTSIVTSVPTKCPDYRQGDQFTAGSLYRQRSFAIFLGHTGSSGRAIAARPPHLEICLAYGEPCEASLTQFSKMLNVALVLLMLEAVHTDLV